MQTHSGTATYAQSYHQLLRDQHPASKFPMHAVVGGLFTKPEAPALTQFRFVTPGTSAQQWETWHAD